MLQQALEWPCDACIVDMLVICVIRPLLVAWVFRVRRGVQQLETTVLFVAIEIEWEGGDEMVDVWIMDGLKTGRRPDATALAGPCRCLEKDIVTL